MRPTSLGTTLLSFSIAFAFIGVLLSNLSWVLLSVTFAGIYVFAFQRFSAEIRSTSLEIERKILDELPFANEPVGVSVEVLNKDPNTVRGTFEDILPDDSTLYAGSNKSSRTLPSRSLLRLFYTFVPQRRGPHTIPGMRIERTDTLGLFEEEQFIAKPSSLSVNTDKGSFDTARRIAGKEHMEFSGLGRNPAIVLRELEFDGIRDYIPGDRARDIHWKLLSKLNKPLTKIYRKEGSVQTTVFVDCGRSMRQQRSRVAKINHALDLSMQLSNVLISSFHPAGVATFDELRVLERVPPGLGKHQFEKVVLLLKNVPTTVKVEERVLSRAENKTQPELPQRGSGENEGFFSALDQFTATGSRTLGHGLEGGVKEIIARNRGQQQLFIVITDLISSRDSVLATANICQSTGNKMIVINTYDEWYGELDEHLDLVKVERMYSELRESLKLEGRLRSTGAGFLRIGPADSAARVTRSLRRGRA